MIVLENNGHRFGLSHGDMVEVRTWTEKEDIISCRFPVWDATAPTAVLGFINKNFSEKSEEFGVGIVDKATGDVVARLDYEGLSVYEV